MPHGATILQLQQTKASQARTFIHLQRSQTSAKMALPPGEYNEQKDKTGICIALKMPRSFHL